VALTEGASIPLRLRPGGRVVGSIGPETEFGSEVILSVVGKRGPWLGVLTPELSNGQIGWIRFDPGKMERAWTKYVIKVDTSAQEMTLRYSGKILSRHTVTVGAVGSETPTGRFAVTDAIDYGASAAYGCCALALTGHQPKTPVGWLGGTGSRFTGRRELWAGPPPTAVSARPSDDADALWPCATRHAGHRLRLKRRPAAVRGMRASGR